MFVGRVLTRFRLTAFDPVLRLSVQRGPDPEIQSCTSLNLTFDIDDTFDHTIISNAEMSDREGVGTAGTLFLIHGSISGNMLTVLPGADDLSLPKGTTPVSVQPRGNQDLICRLFPSDRTKDHLGDSSSLHRAELRPRRARPPHRVLR